MSDFLVEYWKDVIGYKGLYQVSQLGSVRSLDRVTDHPYSGPRQLKGQILCVGLSDGRPTVSLYKEGTRTTFLVGRLVLAAWVGPCPDEFECYNHDGDCTNTSLSNLYWGEKVREGQPRRVKRSDGVEFDSLLIAAQETGCLAYNICAVCRGSRKSCGGFSWSYIQARRNQDSDTHTHG